MSKEKFKDDDHDILLGDNINPQDLTYAGDTEGISSDAADKAAANDDTHSEDQYRPTLVLAEDNSDLRRMLQLQLSHSYHVVTATDGADALEKILDVHPDLIITDLMMPRMDGVELLKRVRRDFSVSHVPVIVLTAKNGDDDMMKAIATGANAATKLYRVAENTERVLALELFNAAQALDFRRPLKSSPAVEKLHAEYRKIVPFIEIDRVMYPLIAKSIEFIAKNQF